MKFIAMYLPQFHEIPENNDAWGNGFTEWTNVKKSRPLFAGHHQPRIPLHNRYYNLLNPDTLKWQAGLAQKYGVDCFCFYHYWFCGRMVLEKPVRLLRKMKHLPVGYCFAWANEPWTKTWHGAGGNKEILIPQTYGGEEDWEKHYQYFLPYFKDERYLKKENKPVVLVYKLWNIPFYNDMVSYWKKRAREDGFSGIYLICMKNSKSRIYASKYVDGTMDFEPNNTKSSMLEESAEILPVDKKTVFWNRLAMKSVDYRKLNRQMLAEPHREHEYRTVFVDYDDTPRRGMKGVVTYGANPRSFAYYVKKNVCLAKKEGNEFLFLNAWNEWGEGNYLEPDVKNGYGYLEAVKKGKTWN